MSNADVLVYVHPELPAQERARLEQAVLGSTGVLSAAFDAHTHPHALEVVYEPEVVKSSQILELVRQHDPQASLVGL